MLSEYKLILKDYILYDSISITFLKWENYRNRTHELKGGGRNRREVGVPQKGIMWDSYHHGNILYLAYINVSILVVTLHQVLRDVTNWVETG